MGFVAYTREALLLYMEKDPAQGCATLLPASLGRCDVTC